MLHRRHTMVHSREVALTWPVGYRTGIAKLVVEARAVEVEEECGSEADVSEEDGSEGDEEGGKDDEDGLTVPSQAATDDEGEASAAEDEPGVDEEVSTVSDGAVDVDGDSEGLARVVDDGRHDQIVTSESAATRAGLATRSAAAKSRTRSRSFMVANGKSGLKKASTIKG